MIPTSTYYPAIYNIISNPLNYIAIPPPNCQVSMPGMIPCSGGFMVYYLPPVVIQ